MTSEQVAELRVILATDVDDVLNWLYGKVHEDLFGLLSELVGILCDRTAKLGIRHNAAAAAQGIGHVADIASVPEFPALVSRIDRVYHDETEDEAIRSSALGAWCSLHAGSK